MHAARYQTRKAIQNPISLIRQRPSGTFRLNQLRRHLSLASKPATCAMDGHDYMRAVQLNETGGAELLKVSNIKVPAPGDDDVVIRNEFAGVNFIDTYHRTGLYPREKPFTLGVEGAGVLCGFGKNVDKSMFSSQTARVVYYGANTYAEYTVVNSNQVVEIPGDITSDIAVTCVTQGMTAHYLACSTFALGPGHSCLVHAASGGTGQLLVQIAKIRGAKVIGTCSKAKVRVAQNAGADVVLPYNELSSEEIIRGVKRETDGMGVDVAYDGVGASTWEISLDSLKRRGFCVLFGNASGPVPPIDPLVLNAKGSLFLTRPKLYDYIDTREQLCERMEDLFRWVREGKLRFNIQKVFELEQAQQAHEFLESGKTEGKVLLKVFN
mmetsp:Transcript_17601/g.29941  ORF Transcript_17601/g.29941 Transcript_17601/m.29941 type:complete len:381 (+) Transcript_17601:60-1202(+)